MICAQEFCILKKIINLNRVCARRPWVSRRAKFGWKDGASEGLSKLELKDSA